MAERPPRQPRDRIGNRLIELARLVEQLRTADAEQRDAIAAELRRMAEGKA